MKLLAFFGLVLGLTLAGCTHTTTLYIDNPDTTFVRVAMKLQTMTRGNDVEIRLKNGQRIIGRNMILSRDSTGWMSNDNSPVTSVANADIVSVTDTDRLQGAIEGGGIGALFGSGVGYLAYKLNSGSGGHPDYSSLAIPALGILGGFAGAVTETANGGHHVISYERKKPL
jgi:hypothetical protein